MHLHCIGGKTVTRYVQSGLIAIHDHVLYDRFVRNLKQQNIGSYHFDQFCVIQKTSRIRLKLYMWFCGNIY